MKRYIFTEIEGKRTPKEGEYFLRKSGAITLCDDQVLTSFKAIILKREVENICDQCEESEVLKKDIYDEYLCGRCLEINQDEGRYEKMD